MPYKPAAIELLLGMLPAPVLAVDTNLRVLFASASFWKLRGVEAALPGTALLSADPALADTTLLDGIQQASSQRGRSTIEPTISNRFLRTTVLGCDWGVLVLLEDQAGKLELDRMRWEIVDGLAHAFQTPLTSIRGYTETLLKDQQVDPLVLQGFLERIHIQSSELIKTVSNLLFLSRLEKAPDLQTVSLDLRRAVVEAAAAMLHAADDKGLALVVDIAEEPLPVKGNHEMLQCAALNLLDNAVKYSNYGGTVKLSCIRRDAEAYVMVEDNGIGMDAASKERIFDKFYRGDPARTGDYLGAGLGLSIVKQIVGAHSGRLFVSSTPGLGSRFELAFPLG